MALRTRGVGVDRPQNTWRRMAWCLAWCNGDVERTARRRDAVKLHRELPCPKKNRARVESVRLNERKLQRVARGSGEVGAHRNLRETAAERSSPVVEFASLGARFVVRREGNERGRGELLIATNGTSNDAVIGEKSRPAFSSLP